MFRHAVLVVVDHGDEHIKGGGSDEVVALVHARPVGVVGAPFVLDEADVPGHAVPEFGEPAFHFMIEGEDHVRPVGVEPVTEEMDVPARFGDLIERLRPPGVRREAALRGEEAGGEAVPGVGSRV
jgi:hypothetical protein